ncbi:D-hexose-6-phosphate mutarotase [Rhodoferax sp.]|uniref:D-hexose-6-phosphate mutarotase n=1 Tax=Rhodoferax sp. TaxID=50421 RepID=UPI00374D3DA5
MSDLQISAETFQNQPCLRLRHSGGDEVLVALHGAHVLSWTSGGTERLYLSPRALFDGQSAIRGGVPICFPQFNVRGPLPKHGFARTMAWTPGPAGDALELQLHSSAATLALWPHAFVARLRLSLAPGSLRIEFSLQNTGDQPLDFALALHTYLKIQQLQSLELRGLEERPYWDDVAKTNRLQTGAVTLDGEVDRVYHAAAAPLELVDGGQAAAGMRIAQSANLPNTVVWNPGAARCATIADLPADGYLQMLCVEAAQIDTPATVAVGARWTGWQQLTVL